jgi:hypothetical protein
MACRVCTANDRDALVEELAAGFRKRSCAGPVDGRPWERPGPTGMRRSAGSRRNMVALVAEELH